jgi:hypothetical protein
MLVAFAGPVSTSTHPSTEESDNDDAEEKGDGGSREPIGEEIRHQTTCGISRTMEGEAEGITRICSALFMSDNSGGGNARLRSATYESMSPLIFRPIYEGLADGKRGGAAISIPPRTRLQVVVVTRTLVSPKPDLIL